MAECGVKQIDDLVAGKGDVPLTPDIAEPTAISVLRDLLICNGENPVSLVGDPHPKFETLIRSLGRFNKAQGIPFDRKKPSVGPVTLQRLTAKRPSADRVYGLASVTLLLDISPFTTAHRVLALTSAFESNSQFQKGNWNSDGAGLSFGIIQWAQSQNRLTEIFTAFKTQNPGLFASIFGPTADKMLLHVKGNQSNLLKLSEVKAKYPDLSSNDQQKLVGQSKVPEFDLTNAYWKPRVVAAGRATVFQKIQVQLAVDVYLKTLAKIQAGAPALKKERSVAFMLDLANQYGLRSAKTKHGALDYYDAAMASLPAQPDEMEILRKIVDKSMELFKKRPTLQKGVQTRRDFFLTTDLLSNSPYQA